MVQPFRRYLVKGASAVRRWADANSSRFMKWDQAGLNLAQTSGSWASYSSLSAGPHQVMPNDGSSTSPFLTLVP